MSSEELPTYNSLVVDVAFQKVVIEEQDRLIHYLKKQLEQARRSQAELKLAEARRQDRIWGIQRGRQLLTAEEVWALYEKNEGLIVWKCPHCGENHKSNGEPITICPYVKVVQHGA